MVLSCTLIPKQAIENQVKVSVEQMNNKDLFYFVQEDNYQTIQDNYADCILLNVIYHQNSQHPFYSTLAGMYYKEDSLRIDEALLESIHTQTKANTHYSQYWHGTTIVLRPLLTIFTLQQIRMIFGGCIILFMTFIGIYCVKNKLTMYYICFILGYVLVQGWMSFYCIEYSVSMLVMTLMLCLLCWLDKKKILNKDISWYFVIAGIFTCFFDFLTTETIVCLLPCAFLVAVHQRDGQLHYGYWKKLLKYICIFGLAYAMMFFFKWVLVCLFLGVDKFNEILQQASLRVHGDIELGLFSSPSNSFIEKTTGAILRNISCNISFLHHATNGSSWLIIGIGFVLVSSVIYMIHTNIKKYHLLWLMLGILPLIRFVVLSNHSYLHFFFTYRALWSTITCILYFIWDSCIKDRIQWKKKFL